MKILLPVSLNPISRRKDRSVKLSYETRELTPDETLTLMSMEGEEGWLLFSTNQDVVIEDNIPQENAELNQKSQAERIRAVLFKLYMQDTQQQKYIGTFPNYYREKTEKYIEFLKEMIKEI